MSKVHFIPTVSLLALPTLAIATSPSADQTKQEKHKPNIVFFIADDMYPEMFNCYPEGKGKNYTPNIDRLAKEGVVMTNQYCVSPVSTASRYNCLTGNYASRATNEKFTEFTKKNEGQTAIQWNSYITPNDKTIATYLHQMGYKTGFVGKNHVVDDPNQLDQNKKPDLYADPRDPKVKEHLLFQYNSLQSSIKKCGFDYADGLYHDNPDWLGIKALASQNMDWVTDAGVRFLDQYKNDPIFLYFATTLPHMPNDPEHSWKANPLITPLGYLDQPLNVQPSRETLPQRLKAAGFEGKGQENLLWLDDALGALINKLDKEGKLDNTIIFFFNDNGQKAKGTLYQGGIQTQLIVWHSKGFKCGKTNNAQVTNVDFLPTILDLAGQKSGNLQCDGVSFAPSLNGEKTKKRETMYFELGYARAVVKGNYKYLALRYPQYAMNYTLKERKDLLEEYSAWRISFGNERIASDFRLPYGHLEMVPGGGGAENEVYGKKPSFSDPDQLYDVSKDPKEMHNLANDPKYKAILAELKKEMKNYLNKLPGRFDVDRKNNNPSIN